MQRLVIENQYFPNVIVINSLSLGTYYVLEQYENYQKMSFRNRTMIVGANGAIPLSIPLEDGRDQKRRIRDVKISYTSNWQVQHLRTIASCYNRSPWFEFYSNELESLFEEKPKYLFDWNLKCVEWVFQKLELGIDIIQTESYKSNYEDPAILDLRNQIRPATLQNFDHQCPKYSQVFEDRIGFLPGMSSLDLLFCTGRKR